LRAASTILVPAAGDQAHAIAIALEPEAITVIFHFMQQSGPAGTLMPLVGRQNSNE
jgi:hypothetical protein